MNLWLAFLLAYFIGSASGSLLLGRRFGIDVRKHGSGNAGATNALRTLGAKFALGVMLIDVGKGVLAVLVLPRLLPTGLLNADVYGGLLALAAAIGHCYPIWHGFRGGKGAATLFGAHMAIAPMAAGIALVAWLLSVMSSGLVGPSTVLAGLALAAAGAFLGSPWYAASAGLGALLLIWTHRGNLQRWRAGAEPRFEKLRLLK
jgi:glycerol-3-phosphate acyltransferase PlsY